MTRPQIQVMDPKRWDFEVFYRVISLSILVLKIWEALQIAAASLECPWSWAQCGEVQNLQLQTFGHLLSELHLRFWWIWLFWLVFVDFLNTRFLSAWAVWIGISTAWLDELWAVTDPWSFPKMKIKIQSGLSVYTLYII